MSENYCESCYKGAIDYGEIYPEHFLILDDDNYFKVVNGHDEMFRFFSKPIKDPYDGLTDEQINTAPIDYTYSNYVSTFRTKNFSFHPQHGHKIVEKCKSVGYNPDVNGWLDYWMVKRAYDLIAAKENLDKTTE